MTGLGYTKYRAFRLRLLCVYLSYSNWIGERSDKDRIKFHHFIIFFILSMQQLLLLRRLFTIATVLGQTETQVSNSHSNSGTQHMQQNMAV